MEAGIPGFSRRAYPPAHQAELRLEGAELTRFDLIDAVGTWNDEHRAACWR